MGEDGRVKRRAKGRRAKGEGRRAKGEGRRAKGEGRRVKGEGRRAKAKQIEAIGEGEKGLDTSVEEPHQTSITSPER